GVDERHSSARVSVECFSIVDAEVVAAGAVLSGHARLETGDCASCPKLTPDVVAVFKDAVNLARGADASASVSVDHVGHVESAAGENAASRAGTGRKKRFGKRARAERPSAALSRRDLFLMGFGLKDDNRAAQPESPASALSGVRLGASAREVYLAALPDPLLPSLEVTGPCTACEVCVSMCPERALGLEDEELLFDPTRCSECGVCVAKCPENVLAIDQRRPGRQVRTLTRVPRAQCTTCGRPLGPHEGPVCHNCSTLRTLTSRIWDMYEEKQ
uniref:4Fe-4S binding protein n=1 Tax=Trueperella sp. TaxID=2699835 RepID=UPI003736275C